MGVFPAGLLTRMRPDVIKLKFEFEVFFQFD